MMVEPGWMDMNTMLLLSVITVGFMMLIPMTRKRQHHKGPPIVSPFIPYVGHIVGIFWYRVRYYSNLSAKYRHEIYTLPILGSAVYIVNSPDLALVAQRLPKQLSFWVLEAKFTTAMGGLSNKGTEALLENASGKMGQNSLVVDGMKGTHKAMIADSKHMNFVAVNRVSCFLGQLEGKGTGIDLWEWVQHVILIATSEGVYGPLNPYNDQVVEQGLLELAKDTIPLLSGVMPRILASRGLKGREEVVAAFKRYFSTNGPEGGSGLVRSRIETLRNYDISTDDIARFETVNGFGILVNTMPTAFWTIYHVFSDPTTLGMVREQVMSILQVEGQKDCNNLSRTIDITRIKALPTLSSILDEVLRFHSSGAGARFVTEDFMFDNRYFLKKDSYLLIPNRDMHFDSSAWGPTANVFDPGRFTKLDRLCPGAFRGFGGGVHLCPGRQFATTIILATVAMFTLRYDMKPASGIWVDPLEDHSNMAMTVALPQKRVLVDIVQREGWEGGSWAFKV